MNQSNTRTWSFPDQASIMELDEAAYVIEDWRRGTTKPTVALTSGGFDPLHAGHVSCIQDVKYKVTQFHRKAHGHCPWVELIVVVNGSEFLKRKKGKEFMPFESRYEIIASLRGVDIVIPFNASDPSDMSVREVLKKIKPDYFAKGGDRNLNNIPEKEICNNLGINVIDGCGGDKHYSSSKLLKEYGDWIFKNTNP